MWVIFDRDVATSISRHVGYAPKAEVKSGYWQSVTTGRSGLMMPAEQAARRSARE
jgi:hypothetical protein